MAPRKNIDRMDGNKIILYDNSGINEQFLKEIEIVSRHAKRKKNIVL